MQQFFYLSQFLMCDQNQNNTIFSILGLVSYLICFSCNVFLIFSIQCNHGRPEGGKGALAPSPGRPKPSKNSMFMGFFEKNSMFMGFFEKNSMFFCYFLGKNYVLTALGKKFYGRQ
jgi:hypothetical protein